MTLPVSASVSATRYWIVALARAVVALAAAAFITFSADHSAALGLLVFGSCVLVGGLVTGVGAFTMADRVLRNVILAQGVFGVAGGILALALHSSGLGVLLYTVSVWAALTGFAELYCGIRARGRAPMSRDWLIVGGLTAVLAVVYLVIPADPVLAVGLFGAYAVVVGVYQAIGAFSLKWSAAAHDTVETHA